MSKPKSPNDNGRRTRKELKDKPSDYLRPRGRYRQGRTLPSSWEFVSSLEWEQMMINVLIEKDLARLVKYFVDFESRQTSAISR